MKINLDDGMPPNLSESLLPGPHRSFEKNEKTGSIEKLQKTESLESCVSIPTEECSCDEASYGIGDAVFSCFIVAPQVVSVWRGTWGIMEQNPELFPYAQIYLLGIVIHICFALVRTKLLARSAGAYSNPNGGAACWITERMLSRVYTYVFILCNIMHWRGGWGLLDAFVDTVTPNKEDPHRPVVIAAITLLFYITITVLRSSRNLLASPYFLVTDGKEPTYIFSTRFNIPNSRETMLYILDCIFSVAVVGSLVVFVWRGSWALLDIFLFPDDQIKSCWTSLIVGYALVVVTFALQAPVRWSAARLHGAPRLLLADVYHLVSFVATVNVWRGVWGLLDIYFFPETPKLSNWCSHVISLTLLILLNCSNSVIVRGVYIDAEEPAGECVVFPCHYLRLFFHKERTKKRHRRALQAAAAAKKPEEASLPLQMPEEKV
ncbi:transmembrane protein fuseless isoform X2 [Anticarsia gemmatalis]|uniref:transmembrane protein fuseless isoform X2 n=1 Tax=Anticarsia gemmatalis TaxID=129554 RepID=UPI003F769BC5